MRYTIFVALAALCSTVVAGSSEWSSDKGSGSSSPSYGDKSYDDKKNGSSKAYGVGSSHSSVVVSYSKGSKDDSGDWKTKTKSDDSSDYGTKTKSHDSKETKAYSEDSGKGNKTKSYDSWDSEKDSHKDKYTTTEVKTSYWKYTHSLSSTYKLEYTTFVSVIISIETSSLCYTTTDVVYYSTSQYQNSVTSVIYSTEAAAGAATTVTAAPSTTINVILSTETASSAAPSTTALAIAEGTFSTVAYSNTSTILQQQLANATAPAAVFTGGAVQGAVGQKTTAFGAGLIGFVMFFL